MRRRIGAVLAAVVLAATACTPSSPGQNQAGPEAPKGAITVRSCTGAEPLIPASAVDPCGLRITEALNSGLTRANPTNGQPELELAEAIENTEAGLFTVRLAKGRKFHDGTEIKARNFVAAWNWAAYGPHDQPSQNWFVGIEGAADMICAPNRPCSRDDRPTDMTGLQIIDDYTFTIRTAVPIVDLRTRLTHPAFSPLPDVFFVESGNKANFGRLPIGSGPFRIATHTETEISLEAAPEYTGPRRPKIAKVTFRDYDNPAKEWTYAKAYNDLVANNLDFSDVIPTDQLVDDVWKSDLKDRQGSADTKTVQSLNFVMTDSQLTDPQVRQAISMAIDREALSRQVFAGTRVPATSWVSPAIPGYEADACGELCTYDLARARQLFAAAGGYNGPFTITVNGDGGHKQWADSVCNQLKNTLELDCRVTVMENQAQVLFALATGRLTGLVRQGWTMDYLSPEAVLSTYGSGSHQNVAGYRNPAYDAKLTEAHRALTLAAANKAYHEAELELVENPPAIPLWFGETPYGWSNRLTDVHVTPFGSLDLTTVRVR